MILDAIVGRSGFLRGSQSQVFGHLVRKKNKKGCPKVFPEKTIVFDDFGCRFGLEMECFIKVILLKKHWVFICFIDFERLPNNSEK